MEDIVKRVQEPVLRHVAFRNVTLVGGLLRTSEGAKDHVMLALRAEQEAEVTSLAYEMAEAQGWSGSGWRGPTTRRFLGHEFVLSARLSNHGVPCCIDDGTLVPMKRHVFKGRIADVNLMLYAYVRGRHFGVGVCLEGLVVRGVPDGLRGLVESVR